MTPHSLVGCYHHFKKPDAYILKASHRQ